LELVHLLAVRRVELHVIRPIRSREAQGFIPLRFFFVSVLASQIRNS
jgi:hypothetical protein